MANRTEDKVWDAILRKALPLDDKFRGRAEAVVKCHIRNCPHRHSARVITQMFNGALEAIWEQYSIQN